jgi:hypothetical protein
VVEPRDVPGHVALGPADEPHLVTSRSNIRSVIAHGAPERLELALVLDRAQLLDEAPARHEVDAASRSCSANDHGRTFASKPTRPSSSSASHAISDRFVLHGLDTLDAWATSM